MNTLFMTMGDEKIIDFEDRKIVRVYKLDLVPDIIRDLRPDKVIILCPDMQKGIPLIKEVLYGCKNIDVFCKKGDWGTLVALFAGNPIVISGLLGGFVSPEQKKVNEIMAEAMIDAIFQQEESRKLQDLKTQTELLSPKDRLKEYICQLVLDAEEDGEDEVFLPAKAIVAMEIGIRKAGVDELYSALESEGWISPDIIQGKAKKRKVEIDASVAQNSQKNFQ